MVGLPDLWNIIKFGAVTSSNSCIRYVGRVETIQLEVGIDLADLERNIGYGGVTL